jgi:hypothetical protein
MCAGDEDRNSSNNQSDSPSDLINKVTFEQETKFNKLIEELKANHPDYNQSTDFARTKSKEYAHKADDMQSDVDTPSKEYIEYQKVALEYLLLHCELSNYASFSDLKNVCFGYKEMGDMGDESVLGTARTVFERLLKEYGEISEYEDDFMETIYPTYASLLNALKDFENAKPIWRELSEEYPNNLSILRSTALCLGGWLEDDGKKFIEIYGIGDYAPDPNSQSGSRGIKDYSALSIWNNIRRMIAEKGKKYSPEWWEANFHLVYVMYRAGHQYPTYFDLAKKVISHQRLFKPEMGGSEWCQKYDYIEKAIDKLER